MCGPEHVLSQLGNIAGTIGTVGFHPIMFEAEMQAQIRDHLHRHTYTLSHSNFQLRLGESRLVHSPA